MDTDIPLYATSEKVLIATSSFSLSVSIITELILCYMFTKGSSRAKFYLRALLFAVLLANCVFSLSAFILVAVLNALPTLQQQHANCTASVAGVTLPARWHRDGAAAASFETPLAQAATVRDWLISVKASQWLCLVVFLLSAVLFVSAWRDLERERRGDDDDDTDAGDCERHMGEKGEIFI